MDEGNWDWYKTHTQLNLIPFHVENPHNAQYPMFHSYSEFLEDYGRYATSQSDVMVASGDSWQWFRPDYIEFLKFIEMDYPDISWSWNEEIASALHNLKEVVESSLSGEAYLYGKTNIDIENGLWRAYGPSVDTKDMLKDTHKITPPAPVDFVEKDGVVISKGGAPQQYPASIEKRIDYLWEYADAQFGEEKKPVLHHDAESTFDFRRINWFSLHRNRTEMPKGFGGDKETEQDKSSFSVNTRWKGGTEEYPDGSYAGFLRIDEQNLFWRPMFTCPWYGKVVMVNRKTNNIAATFYYFFTSLLNIEIYRDEFGKNLKRYISFYYNDTVGRGFGSHPDTTDADLVEFLKKRESPSYHDDWDSFMDDQIKTAWEQAYYDSNPPTIMKAILHEDLLREGEEKGEWDLGEDAEENYGTTFYSPHPWISLKRKNGGGFPQFQYFTQYDTYIAMLNEEYYPLRFGLLNWTW